MKLTRVAVTAAATLTHQFVVGETATPVDSGTVTVTIKDPDGTTIDSGAATFDSATVTYSRALPAQAELTWLDVTWSGLIGGATVVESERVEIVGGFLFDLKTGRDSHPDLADQGRYTLADLIDARLQTELECEWICLQGWVRRYRRVRLDGTGTRDLPMPDGGDEFRAGVLLRGVHKIRSAAVAPRFGQPLVALTAGQLAALTVRPDGSLRRTDDAIWTAGDNNVLIEYEYGNDGAPAEIVKAGLMRFRSRLQLDKSQIPDSAVTFTVTDQGTFRHSLPDAFRTGIPNVDAAYARYSRRVSSTEAPGARPQPASATLHFDPQFHSLFHGGRQ